jgi:hypothetical protein
VNALTKLDSKPKLSWVHWFILSKPKNVLDGNLPRSQEQGLRRAHTAADVVKPDLAIALEVVSADVILIPGGFATRTRVGNLSL